MPSDPSPRIRCQKCGAAWTARKAVTAKRRQCPRCYSRDLAEVDGAVEDDHMSDAHTAYDVMEDPEVRQKLKELELAKLERQIQDAKGELTKGEVDRITSSFLGILAQLSMMGVINDARWRSLSSDCPWCGADSGLNALKYDRNGENFWAFLCCKCRRRVEW